MYSFVGFVGIMTLRSTNSCAFYLLSLSRVTSSTVLSLFQENNTMPVEHSLDLFAKLICIKFIINQAGDYLTQSQLQTRVSASQLPSTTKWKYYHWSISEFIVWTNLIVKRTFSHLQFRLQCVGQQFTLGHVAGSSYCLEREASMLSTRSGSLFDMTLPSYYTCNSKSFLRFLISYGALAWLICPFFFKLA